MATTAVQSPTVRARRDTGATEVDTIGKFTTSTPLEVKRAAGARRFGPLGSRGLGGTAAGAAHLSALRSRLTSVSQQLSPGAETILDERTEFRVEEGDHERFSHFVPKEKLTEAMVMGTPVVALCGKVWVPSRDPQRFPVCPECKEIWEGFSDKGKGSDDDEQ
jgi:hypothetical protein